MYYGATPNILGKAKVLRKNLTHSEKMLWERLRRKQIMNLRFREQHPIDIFIVDFYCHAARLVVELDGEIHLQKKEYDEGRSAEMEKYYIKVIRFSNEEVEKDIENVIKKITSEVKERLESPPWGI